MQTGRMPRHDAGMVKLPAFLAISQPRRIPVVRPGLAACRTPARPVPYPEAQVNRYNEPCVISLDTGITRSWYRPPGGERPAAVTAPGPLRALPPERAARRPACPCLLPGISGAAAQSRDRYRAEAGPGPGGTPAAVPGRWPVISSPPRGHTAR